MSLIQRLSNSVFFNQQNLLLLVSLFAVFGTLLELSGGVWDTISHILKEPEFFWTIQHVTVYSGVALIGSAGILGFLLLQKKSLDKFLRKGILLMILGSIIQITSGFADSLSHEVFGIDGLVSWSHQPLEAGLVMCSLGGFLIISVSNASKIRKFLPISIMVLILSVSWLGFNLSLLVGSIILCIPIYEIFSDGCAIL